MMQHACMHRSNGPGGSLLLTDAGPPVIDSETPDSEGDLI